MTRQNSPTNIAIIGSGIAGLGLAYNLNENYTFSKDFLNLYLIPIASAIWSIKPNNILEFPITTLYQFFYNHGFLGLNTHFQ